MEDPPITALGYKKNKKEMKRRRKRKNNTKCTFQNKMIPYKT